MSAAALGIRVVAMIATIDESGDGPTHAMQAYEWSRHPHFITSGVWLPGFTYWAGTFAMAIPNPLVAARLMNVLLGTLTVPLFYLLLRRLFGPAAALLGALTLAAFPLHVGLSASSLTEPSFLFLVVAALLCLAESQSPHGIRRLPFGLFLLFFVLAEVTRYEAWPLIALVLAYLVGRRCSMATLLVSAAVLLLFPAAWSIGTYVNFGSPFYGFLLGAHPLEGGSAVSVATALANVIRRATGFLGYPLSFLALGGLLAELVRSGRGASNAERTGYALLVATVWVLIVVGAWSLGSALYGRYLLLGCVLALPLASLPDLVRWEPFRRRVAIAAVIGIGCVVGAYVVHRPVVWVTRSKPVEIVRLAQWLRGDTGRDAAVLLTKMEWKSTYLPLYLPQLSGRYFIVSIWVDDAELRRFVTEERPALLITQQEDGADRARIERVLGHRILAGKRVFAAGQVEVYDLSS